MANILGVCGVLAMLVASGCGDPSPEEKCQDLVSTLCGRVTTCLNVPSQRAECVRGVNADMSCSAAKSVSDSFDTCIDQLHDVSCDALLDTDADGEPVLTLPASCRGVLQTGGLAAPSTSFVGLRGAEHLIGP